MDRGWPVWVALGLGFAASGCWGKATKNAASLSTDGSAAAFGSDAGGQSSIGGASSLSGVGGLGNDGTDGQLPCRSSSDVELPAEKRLVRLTFSQLTNSLGALFGVTLKEQIQADFEVPGSAEQAFPPLSGVNEGSMVTEAVWTRSDAIAQAVGEYVLEHAESVTGCDEAAGMGCAEDYLLGLAERAFRRPLGDADSAPLVKVLSDVRATDASIAEILQYGVYAVMSSPHFLYRTEFGSDPYLEEQLTDYELASQLSYFLTDGPPDAELNDAAARGALGASQELFEQTSRILQSSEAREHLTGATFSELRLGMLANVILDPEVAPDLDDDLRTSMMREGRLFLDHTLWGGLLGDLVTSRIGYVDERLAALYGVEYPPPGAELDADGFTPVELPEVRTGLLTSTAFLTSLARPEGSSVVGRGFAVGAHFACVVRPPFPENLASEVEAINVELADATEREKMDYRLALPECGGCHVLTDPFGMVLHGFDVIGRHRTEDPEGRPIDTSVTLSDGTAVADAPELGRYLDETGTFARCMAMHFLNYALADGRASVSAQSCAVEKLVEGFDRSDKTFSDLIREVASSRALRVRAAGSEL